VKLKQFREATMLALSRFVGERIMIGEDIVIEVRKIIGNRVVISVSAPDDVAIDREEIHSQKQEFGLTREVRKTRLGNPKTKEGVREADPAYAQRAFCFESVMVNATADLI